MAFRRFFQFSHRHRANNLLQLSKVTVSPSRYVSLSSSLSSSSSSSIDHAPNDLDNPQYPRVTVWWDSSCPLCLREMALMKRWARPGTVAFIDIASPSSTTSCPIDRKTMLARFHAQERDGPLVHGAQAFALLWKHIPRVQRIGWYLTRHPRALNTFEWFYTNIFLSYIRPILQKSLKRLGLEGRKSV
jgi:predicted DCC family thiol-disulfide oxidoreductase YuxK